MNAVFKLDEERKPTTRGYEWRCNACPFVSESLLLAESHVASTESPYPHLVYETQRTPGKDEKGKDMRPIRRRRIVLNRSGVGTRLEMAPPPKRSRKKAAA